MRVLFIIVCLMPLTLLAQNDRISEDEIQDQAKFLDALQLRILEKYDEAIEAFSELEKEDPQNDVVHFELAKLYWVKRQDKEADFHAQEAVKYNKDNLAYKEFLIDLYSRTKDYVELNEVLNSFIRDGNFDENYYFQLANSYRKTGHTDKALELIDELEERVGYKKSIGEIRSSIYKNNNKKRKLMRELERLMEYFPDDKDVLTRCAILMESVGEENKAYEIYKALLNIDPDNVTATKKLTTWNNKASTETEFLSSLEPLIRNEQYPRDEKIKELIPYVSRLEPGSDMTKEMIRLLEILQTVHPNDARVNALHGDVYFNIYEPSEAIIYYKRTTELDRSVFMVWKNLMIAQDKILDFEALKKTAEQAVDYFPNQALCYYYAGKAEIELGNLDNGMEWLQEGLFLTNKNAKLQAEFKLMMVNYHIQTANENTAQKLFSEIKSEYLGPRHALYFEVKGDLEYLAGKKGKAIQSWKQSIQNGGLKSRIESKINKAENS